MLINKLCNDTMELKKSDDTCTMEVHPGLYLQDDGWGEVGINIAGFYLNVFSE